MNNLPDTILSKILKYRIKDNKYALMFSVNSGNNSNYMEPIIVMANNDKEFEKYMNENYEEIMEEYINLEFITPTYLNKENKEDILKLLGKIMGNLNIYGFINGYLNVIHMGEGYDFYLEIKKCKTNKIFGI